MNEERVKVVLKKMREMGLRGDNPDRPDFSFLSDRTF